MGIVNLACVKAVKEHVRRLMMPLATPFCGVSPNALTLVGLSLCTAAGALLALHRPVVAGVLILLGGFFDVMDGTVARQSSASTPFGGFLDSVSDRLGDGAILIGAMLGGYTALGALPDWFLGALALLLCLMVSYTRARAEALGLGMEGVGIGERAERMLALAVGAVLGLLSWAVALVVVLASITLVQRVLYAKRMLS
ncbi:MAG: CDP-diacylglycerol-inositol 3-phosphatidyltransferase [Euryarchaeota archaeon 55_53]|nr:MAG: CDP-diacylglycerol-inositol 3-phosphatidyltransferase [Euryarchaeota archaeon 55_53]